MFRGSIKTRVSDESGFALVLALAIVVALGAATTSVAYYATSNFHSTGRDRSAQSAFSLAEAGLNLAYATLEHAPNPGMASAVSPSPVPDAQLPGGFATYYGTFDAATKIWTLTGIGKAYDPARPGRLIVRQVRGRAHIGTATVGDKNNAVWNYVYADATTGCTTIANFVNVNVPLYTRGNLCLQNQAVVTSYTVQVGGRVTMSSPSNEIGDPGAYLHRVGALIESPAFYASLTGAENLRLFATVGRHDDVDVDALLATVGLADRGRDRYRTYSLGMKQRLGIAAALLGDPALLILDEPANGLDPQGVHEMRGLIGSLAHSGRTVLVSSHDLSELEQICDWLVLIEAGRSIYQGPAAEFIGTSEDALSAVPEHRTDVDLLAAVLRSAGHRADVVDDRVVVRDDDLAGRDLAAAVNRSAHRDGIVLVELSPVRSSLEDRYLALVRTEVGTR